MVHNHGVQPRLNPAGAQCPQRFAQRRATMRNVVLAFVAAGSAVALAAPASAQYYPQSYGNGYGYNNGTWGDPGEFQRRLFNVRRSLGSVQPDQAYRLDTEARTLEGQLRAAARNGLNPSETQYFNSRVYQ